MLEILNDLNKGKEICSAIEKLMDHEDYKVELT